MKWALHLLPLSLLLALTPKPCLGFTISPMSSAARSVSIPPQKVRSVHGPCLAIKKNGEPSQYLKASEERGTAIFIFVLAVNVWLFSLPPEFRRTEICLGTRVNPGDCVTFNEWAQQVKSYYDAGKPLVRFDGIK